MRLIFEWDRKKSASNFRKHKVKFDEAKDVFSDAHAVTFRDDTHSDDEMRLITIGMSMASRVLLVVHTEADAQDTHSVIIRIISCRKATAEERAIYEKG